MSGSRSLGTLTLDLIAKIGGWSSGMDKAGRDAQKNAKLSAQAWKEAGDQIKSVVTTSVAAFTGFSAAGTAAFAAFKKQVDSFDAFNDIKDATGASVEAISALDRVARETGTNIESVESILVKFNSTLKEAKPGDDSDSLFKGLNLNIQDLKNLDPAEALRQVAVAFSKFENDGNKARAMQVLFGKSVKEAAPFLNDLAEKTKLVGTVTTQTAAQAEIFNKQMSAMKASATDAARSIASDMLPVLNRFLQNAREISKMGGFGLIVKDAAKDVFGLGKMTGDNAADIKQFMRDRERLQKDLDFATRKGFGTRSIESGLEENARFLEILRLKQRSEIEFANLGVDYGDAVSRKFLRPEILDSGRGGGSARSGGAKSSSITEAQRYLENLQKQLEKTQALSATEQLLLDIQKGRLGFVSEAMKQTLTGYAQQIDAANELEKQEKARQEAEEEAARSREALFSEGLAIFNDTRTAVEEYSLQMDRMNVLLTAGAISADTYDRAVRKLGEAFEATKKPLDEAAKEFDQFTKNAAENIQRSIGDGLVDLLEGNFDDIGKKFGKMLARMAADALAADIARKLFGGVVKGGEGEGVFGSLLGALGGLFSFGGGKASGGPVMPNTLYQVNERGPEMFQAANGGQFLMTGANGGKIIPNHALGGVAEGATVINNFTVGDVASMAEVKRVVAASQAQTAGRFSRSRQYGGSLS